MTRRAHRHPALETAVFAAALLLAAFVARELWIRRAPAAPKSGPPAAGAVPLNPERPPAPGAVPGGKTERAVTKVPALRLTRIQRPKPKPAAVPAP